jgi:superfamily II DNA or RNA helicase
MPSHPDESAALAIQTPAINDRSLAAGLAYAMGSRVSGISFDAATGLMLGKVRGGSEVPYSTTAKLVRKAGGWSCTVGVCSCPVRKDCKHVAALLFAAEDNPATRVQLLAPADTSRLSRQVPVLEVPDWEQALGPLIARPGITQSTNGIPLALQFEIEEPAPHFSYTGRRDPLRSVRQLKARPVIMGAKGKWIRGDVSWNTLSYLNYRRECNEAHVEWMQEFLASHTALANRQHSGSAPWLGLNTYAGKNLWSLLAEARKIGVALVHGRGQEPVRVVETPAAVGLNLTRFGERPNPDGPAAGAGADADADSGGGLSLAPTITVEGVEIDPAQVGTIGRPAHGIFLTSDDDALPGVAPSDPVITLAPLEAGLSEELLTFVTAGSTLHIPARDETRFLTGFYPKLKQSARVTASDESVELPALAVPTLSLLANYGADHRVRLHWEWHYKSGKLVTSQPLWRHPGDHGYRDDPAEAGILETVGQPWDVVPALGESATGGWGTPRLAATAELSGLDTLAFTEEVLPRLRELPGVAVDTAGDIADYREAEEAPVVAISTKATDSRDWFDLGIVITLEGQPVSFAALFSALAAGQTRMLLPSGAYFSLDLPELHQLRALIDEARSLQDNKDAPLQISRFQAGLWDELAQLGVVDEQAAAWRQAVGGLLEGGVQGLPLPSTLNADLRPYQLEGFNWLSFLYRHGLGGVLADDMGLGKTVQALALICAAKEAATDPAAAAASAPDAQSGTQSDGGPAVTVAPSPAGAAPGAAPFLVVAPTSVVGNWEAEAARFAPGLTVRAISETFAKSGSHPAEAMAGADIVITSYALFRIDYEAYASLQWAGFVLDEAQFVKNHQSKAYQCARKLPAVFKLAITGTPLENNLMEFWALTSIVAPGLFSSPKRFAEYYQKPVEKNGDKAQLDKLRRRVRPLMMRRTKEQVIHDLPPKQEQILEVVLNPRHQKVYQTHLQRERQKILGLIDDVNKNRFTIFQSLTLLRQLSLDPSLIDPSLSGVRSSKLDVLFEQLEDLVAEGHRALIFSQFTGFLGKVRERLVEENIEFCYLDGSTRNRTDVVNEFKNGAAPVFLISLKAGGFGLNLTEADYVFLLDPWWNPASEAQAVDRTHRIGQARNVMVYRLVAKDTIEEKVMALKAKKSQLFADVMQGDALSGGALTAEDLAGLFND